MEARLISPGSCGELIQGTVGNQDFLITCPINLYSQVTIKLSPFYQGVSANIRAEKTIKAVQRTLELYKKTYLGAQITLKSQLFRCKGMASSTADITAAVGAVMIALGKCLDLEIIKQIALEIEPTDGTFLPGLTLFDHKKGRLDTYLGKPPKIDILIFAEQGDIDTIDFNQRSGLSELNRRKENQIQRALNLVKQGILLNDPWAIGKGATLSSFAHQSILYKPALDELQKMVKNIDMVYGINIAHSGTLIGVLINKNYQAKKLIAEICQKLSGIQFLKRVAMISGGLRF